AAVNWGFINPRYHIRSLAGEVAAFAKVMTRAQASERPHLAAAISKDPLQVDIRDSPLVPPDARPTRQTAWLHRMIDGQLQEVPGSFVLQTLPAADIHDNGDAAIPPDRAWQASDLIA